MGLQELPNGLEYFSVSEELQIWFSKLFAVLNPFNIGLFVVLTVVLAVVVVVLTLYLIKKNVDVIG